MRGPERTMGRVPVQRSNDKDPVLMGPFTLRNGRDPNLSQPWRDWDRDPRGVKR